MLDAGSAHVGSKSVQASPPLPPTPRQPRAGQQLHTAPGTRLPLMSLSACSSVLLVMTCGFRKAAPALPFHLHSRLQGEKGPAGPFPLEELHPEAFTAISLADVAVPAAGCWDLTLRWACVCLTACPSCWYEVGDSEICTGSV